MQPRFFILISIDFGDFIPSFSPHLTISLGSYIKHSKQLKLVKKNSAAPRFSTHFAVLGVSDETLFLVFDILPQTVHLTRKKQRN